ncbi:hypothetical protein DPMN_006587 [Dreissena polymorpha]|uniref:Uncharacterized protein n=1 Tax=Dreissena polymorpha TaxID=45954 RepID=A0A9D4RXL4_DREPO|nr:hypothetical protein DPMN_006587 [Dreissena polymorpha]
MTEEVIVAEIEDDALLGYDFLRRKQGRPADILLSKNKIVLVRWERNTSFPGR